MNQQLRKSGHLELWREVLLERSLDEHGNCRHKTIRAASFESDAPATKHHVSTDAKPPPISKTPWNTQSCESCTPIAATSTELAQTVSQGPFTAEMNDDRLTVMVAQVEAMVRSLEVSRLLKKIRNDAPILREGAQMPTRHDDS